MRSGERWNWRDFFWPRWREVDLTASLPEAPEAVLEPAQEQEFQRKQKRRLIAGWTLVEFPHWHWSSQVEAS